ncbi:helix-turn-helix domain-containing protein [uncultured Porphyromonas sp.]|uniref:helix-turn-helix domain-containing protein n=1 Tax=uncultured Porphyromonas sp. TaxID=159274 RepID=UPI0026288C29|nr:helix-turn-helix domain-containing protein [uncultured Porphyromonas sp.]
MALFNPPEHLSCHHYATHANTGWVLVDGSEQQFYRGETEYHLILFCTKGSIRLASEDDLCELHAGQMKFIPRDSSVHAYLSHDGELLSAYFDVIDFICDKISLQQLKELKDTVTYNPNPLEVRGAIPSMLATLKVYLEDKALCAYLHELKVKELFWNLRAYYSREELAAFLSPVLGVSKFHNEVINAFTCNTKVADLAERVYMATSTFYKQFREEFGETPEQWIRTQSNKQILFLIQDYDLTIGEIATRLSFGSLSSFSRYCSKNFGYAPTALRKALQSGVTSEELMQAAHKE